MAEQNSKPGLKMVLEIGPLILFFVGYFLLRDKSIVVGSTEYDGFIMITALFVPVLIISTVLLWKLTGELSRMQIMTVFLVIVFGGLTVFLNDERFIKMKPTIIYLLFTVTLGFGLLQKKSYLQSLMGQALPLTDRGWMVLTQRTTLFFLFLAITNEIIWRFMSTDAWVTFKTFGLTGLSLAFFGSQMYFLRKHLNMEMIEKN